MSALEVEHLSIAEIEGGYVDRERLRALLERWAVGGCDGWFVVAQAEAFEADLGDIPDYPDDDERSIAVCVVSDLLALAHHQWLLQADIPQLLSFLDTERGSELTAHTALRAYLHSTLTKERELEAQRYFFGTTDVSSGDESSQGHTRRASTRT